MNTAMHPTLTVSRGFPAPATAGGNSQRLVVLHQQTTHPTSGVEHLLLLAMAMLTPLEDHLPAIAGRSVLFLVFALLACYVVLMRPWAFASTWNHPVFLAGYTWLGLAAIIESLHPHPNYSELVRIAQMLLGGVFMASLCRDMRALQVGMYGYLLAGLWLTVLLFLTTYGTLQGAQATDFQEATRVRSEVFRDQPLALNLNRMAFFTAQGAVVALVMALTAQATLRRNVFLGVTAVCLVATCLPLSRSGIIIAIVSCAVVTLCYGMASRQHFNRFLKTLLLIVALGGGVLALVPEAVFARFTFPQTFDSGQAEGRTQVYLASLEHFPDYIVSGVGAGNFWGAWGQHSHFYDEGGMHGAHNGLVQVAIYWGIIGLFALCVLLYLAYRCLPRRCGTDALSLGLLGISVALLLYFMVTHEISFKGFALGLGSLVGARRWIWPRGVVSPSTQQLAYLRNAPEAKPQP